MSIPYNVLSNADDLGLNITVNKAIAKCFELRYINSASVLTNTQGFSHSVQLVHDNTNMKNIGVHINLAEGKPVTNFDNYYLDAEGNWDVSKTGKILTYLTPDDKKAFAKEIDAQINLAITNKLEINHLDSHYHLHTLPAFYKLFLAAAKRYQLKLRLAQTYNEGSYIKYAYRSFINGQFTKAGVNYSALFETVHEYLDKPKKDTEQLTEVMLHPDLDAKGNIVDNYDNLAMVKWLEFINNKNKRSL